ncbi:FadR family transcriptional regulator [Nocardioides immobilis]|uniref:FadR family transcriptional regulator n=1 Tax=Nocardioides immobilis TaxID=2049295 RepID=A0A417XXB0_9ACTN|nr:GntR family transcriptional regulator [Nocardioides immobilis]RHW24955.1 FadR family transcriptional regulator [Nocardioides immobilis]
MNASTDNRRRRVVTPRRATDAVIHAIKGDILSGQLARGDRLPTERELAEEFGVSQPTIRECLRVLEAIGLVEVQHGRGAFVTGDVFTIIDTSLHELVRAERVGIAEVTALRETIARQSAAECAKQITKAQLAHVRDLEQKLSDVSSAGSWSEVAAAGIAFQTAIAEAASNPLALAIERFLIETSIKFQILAFSSRPRKFWLKWAEEFRADRAELLAALEAKDGERTVSAMVEYLDHQRRRFSADPALSKLRLADVLDSNV